MKQARMIGDFVRNLAAERSVSNEILCDTIGCSPETLLKFFDGRALLSFDKIKKLSDLFDLSIDELLGGNEERYNLSVVHCMNEFDNVENRELILDIIDSYLDVKESVDASE